MCEWLSCGEWCDVQLLCGGRVFSAHRAVLASVSTFLRNVLLSCPIQESPTFIVLPDFDIDAMSSVLYYIYNGEVIVQQEKLDMFLDVIKAMQIFIDYKYLPKLYNINQYDHYNTYSESQVVKNDKVFVLDSENSKDQKLVTVRKGENIYDALQYSLGDLDQQVRIQNWSEQHKTALGNQQSPYRFRQRNSLLRDLFIETYPRNGNVNGLTTGVLAISNERYRGATSVLLTNANGKHPRPDDTLTEISANITEHTSDLPRICTSQNNTLYPLNFPHDFVQNKPRPELSNMKNCSPSEFDMKLLFANCTVPRFDKGSLLNCFRMPSRVFPDGVHGHNFIGTHVPSLDLSFAPHISNTILPKQFLTTNTESYSTTAEENQDCYTRKKIRENTDTSTSSTKMPICNQVLASPWSARLPNNYHRPFRRKSMKSLITETREEGKREINDSNNNIQIPLAVEADIERTNASDNQDITYSAACHTDRDDYKCAVCNQIFTSNDSLTTHMRKHTSSARYTCGECGKSFSQLRNFKYHMSVHRGTREFAATCTVCGKYFNDRGYLSSHMKIHRNRKEYKCSMCPKSFNQRVAYNMHVRIHTGVKPHVCEECGKAFSRKMLLKQHQRTHSGERPYACPHCDKRFADRSNMTLHLRLHTGVKPFSCTLCPKSFTKKHHLKSHLNFHTGAKPYSCPRCNLGFTQSSNMRTHLKKCSAPEPSSTDVNIQQTQN